MEKKKSNGSRALSVDERDDIGTALHEARALALVLTSMDPEEFCYGEICTFANMIFERVETTQKIIKGTDQG